MLSTMIEKHFDLVPIITDAITESSILILMRRLMEALVSLIFRENG